MLGIKQKINETLPLFIEKVGTWINPLLLKLMNEQDQLLVFYFHGLYETDAQKAAHHVDPQNNLTLRQFERFVKYFLKRGYRFIHKEDLLKGLEGGHPYLMLTFDDGYYNNSLALRILEKYEIPATFFITARNVLNNKSYWWDIIYKYRKKAGVSLNAIRMEQERMKDLSYREIDAYIVQQFGEVANNPWSDIDRPFTAEELRAFAQSPYVSIGNHTFHHTILPNYEEAEIRREFVDSNQALTEIIGYEPQGVAFPNGNYNDMVLRVAEEVGFQFAFTVVPKKNFLPMIHRSEEMVCLDRFMPEPRNIEEYASFCRVGYHPLNFYNRIKNRLKILKRRYT